MVPDESPFSDVSTDRDYLRVLLTAVCVVAVIVATAALPVLSPAGTESPIESLVPLPQEDPFGSAGGQSVGGSGGSLGALNPGSQTDVGGSIDGSDSPYRSQGTETHFTVTSTESAYWRTGAYETYTGTGWDGNAEPVAVDGPMSVEGMKDGEVSYEVRLAKTASSLPTVWRPKSVSREDAMVTEYGAVRSERPVPAGTTYSATSVTPPTDPSVLRSTGRDYPAEIESRYTEIPASTSARVGPFTDRLTEDSESPYETATTIETWLETNKEYSLNVSQPPDDDVASEFIFEMDTGYCEYFASSMAVMLRSQDIPARYVVGYSTGEQTGKNEYTVRSMNAHAWVEVYFEGVGWVKFDPTPGQERLDAEQQALQDEGESYSANETGSPDEEFSVGTPTETAGESADGTPTETASDEGGEESGGEDTEGTPTSETDSGDDETTATDGEYRVSLNRSATPGATVTATVTQDGAPVEGATVAFNGEPVGETGPDGSVVGTIPYDDELTVTVSPPADAESLAVPAVPGERSRSFAVAGPTAQQSTNESFEMETNASVSVTGETVTGAVVIVTASVDDVPVRDGDVYVNEEQVATTDRDGRATITLPETPGNVSIVVERDAVSGARTLELDALTVETSPTLPLPLPGAGQTVNATMGGEPVPNATVSLDGDSVATTGVDGTATVGLPLASGTTVTVSRYGQQATTTVDGLLRNLVGTLLAAGLLVGGAVAAGRRSGLSPGTAVRWVRAARAAAVGALVGIAAAADGLLGTLWTRIRLTVQALRDLVAGRVTVAALLDALRAWIEARIGDAEATASAAFGTATAAEATADATPAARVTVREAWDRFLGTVTLRRYWTHTPGEIADHAIETDDLPPSAVRTVRDAFRAVEYGQRDATAHVAAVEQAIETIEVAAEERSESGEPADADAREVQA